MWRKSLDCSVGSPKKLSAVSVAAPVSYAGWFTTVMLMVTFFVPIAACSTLWVISRVATPCSSTTNAIEFSTLLIFLMVPIIP